MRLILYTGKGGVGKTSVAAATALRSAQLGYRTIIFSTDPAHSLADSFDVPLAPEPVPIAKNLWGQEIDVLSELGKYWNVVQDWLTALMRWQGVDEVVADELAVLPGMDELVGLLYITRYHEQGEYDVVIVDCAPTGETLRLLSFPEMARWYMERIFPMERRAAKMVAPIVRPLFNIPIPDDNVFDSVQHLFSQIEKMKQILTDAENSSVRLVVNAEKMVVKESQRTFTYLNLYGYACDLVVCNRLIPDEVKDSYFSSWKDIQGKHLLFIEECFSPIPIFKAPLFEKEVVGLPMLREMANALFGSEDPTRVFSQGHPHEIETKDGYYVLHLSIPMTEKEDISVIQHGDELVVQAGHHRRNILLPRSLAGLSVGEAKFERDKLKITFQKTGKRRGKNLKTEGSHGRKDV
ncbi:MAG: ArsA family ATPase [Chloroflexi bacterium]|nr:ArsA family ATPase [Chloroflexota bacterium]